MNFPIEQIIQGQIFQKSQYEFIHEVVERFPSAHALIIINFNKTIANTYHLTENKQIALHIGRLFQLIK